jgi:hypothetical protein
VILGQNKRGSWYAYVFLPDAHDMSSQATSVHNTLLPDSPNLQWALTACSANVLVLGAMAMAGVSLVQAWVPSVTVLADEWPHNLSGPCVIADATQLSRDQQAALTARLLTGRQLRVITLSPVALYPLVLAGTFDDALYYRLNTITVEYVAE